jgi:arginyl-tRNA synthetase
LDFIYYKLNKLSSPNIAKPLHAGHMRSTFLGNFLSNIHQKLLGKVTRINFLGDWGTQYGNSMNQNIIAYTILN